ncbi:hypothetical protein HDV00_003986 [Rhizophlyctis rosea]|nr:hypothetical protein HDV00_003986 [Rhizophlyctis rosea]
MPRTPSANQSFIKAWVDGWNAHDLPAILAHYHPNITFTSPLITTVLGDPSSTVTGINALRDYWTRALALITDRGLKIHFDVLHVCHGVDMCSIVYRSAHVQKVVVESFWFDVEGKVIRACSAYQE